MINALVIDLEHWHCIELLRNHIPENPVDQVPESVRPILDLLDKYEIKATFAVLGTVAEQHPELIKEIYDKGHEIASHAWSHKTLHELGKDAFEEEIKKSVKLLESITGEPPIGFRAPSFSIDNTTKWAFDVLEKYGFKYDASVFPIKTMLYGLPDAPLYIYRPSKEDVTKNDPNGKIIEFPMTILKLGKNIPIAGGFYLRALPLWFLKYGIREVNKDRPAIIYIHPWETYCNTPRLKIPPFSRFVTYQGINYAFHKLDALLNEFNFMTIRDAIKNYYNILNHSINK
jgi:peptidoglycan-N-acetylglucosamine deacetylase